jgi:uncharacterized protein
MDQRISAITLGVKDLKESTRFYQELGWKSSSASNEMITFFQAGGLVFALYPWKLLAEDALTSDDSSGFRGVALAYNVPNKEEVRQVLDKAVKAGAKLIKEAQEVFWGGYSGYFADPSGHLWEVAWNPFWTLTKDGAVQLPK